MRPYLLLTRRSFQILLTLCALVLAGEASAQEIEICYNFSCKTRQTVTLSQTEWHSIIGWFYPGATSAAGEREQLRRAIGWMEVVVGRHTPTHRDKGLNLEKNPSFPGQLDCIDESLNVTTYMMDRAYRSGGFDAHWAGQLQEVATGERFVIDSWFQDNGMLPYIARSAEWEDLTEARIVLFSGAD